MKGQLSYKKIKLKHWPFKPGETTKLFWVDHPYRDLKGRWTMAVYFRSIKEKQEITRCDIPWGTLEFMRIGRLYRDGMLLSTEEFENYGFKDQVDKFIFYSQSPSCATDIGRIITGDGRDNYIKKNYFILKSTEGLIRIPVIEVIRSMLTKNRKLNYAILEPNSLENYFLIEREDKRSDYVKIYFTKDYPADLLSKRHLKHLIWLGTSNKAARAWREVYHCVANENIKGIHFPFPLEGNFEITARYKKGKDGIIRFEEIISFKEKNAHRIFADVFSPHIHEVKRVNKPKLRRHIILPEEILEIEADSDGSRKSEKTIPIETSQHDFEIPPIIRMNSQNTIFQRMGSDKNTKDIEIDSNSNVTTTDVGGADTEQGLEFQELDDDCEICDGDVGLFVKTLIMLKSRNADTEVIYTIGDLPEGMIGRWYHKLEDGITPRKYVIAVVSIAGYSPFHLIEVERQGRPLSTLVIVFDKKTDNSENNMICQRILKGLVNNNGSWNHEILDELFKNGVRNERIKHTRKKWSLEELADRLYDKLLNI